MTKFAIFADGTYWGSVEAENERAAVEKAVEEWGTPGEPGADKGLGAIEVSDAELRALEKWWHSDAPADECPLTEQQEKILMEQMAE